MLIGKSSCHLVSDGWSLVTVPDGKPGWNFRLCIAHGFSSGYPADLTDGRLVLSVLSRDRRSGQIPAFPRRGGGKVWVESGSGVQRACPSPRPRKREVPNTP